MNKRIKKLWVAALRSGEYKQGRRRLRSNVNTFCCLGVLCNIHAQEHPKIAAAQKDSEQYMGSYAQLPKAVVRWAGLETSPCTCVRIAGNLNFLAVYNDNGVPFSQIADAIEEQL